MKIKQGCPSCDSTGRACCVEYLWLAEKLDDERRAIVFERDGGAGDRLGYSDGHITLFFSYCPYCGTKLGRG